ncbi:MAG: ferrous iron transport protein B [Candidatus Aenigmarchaeota archaeon]|nr:ferrous iron transport protein B [Candidatus Aenigmarchaeota archaeon]
MNDLKVLLIGQPNVGKSSLLNALVGPRATVSNYPGTTVEVTKAKKKISNMEIEFVDTPGIYSISDRSEEEKVAEKALFEEDKDGVIAVVDATSLERSLYMVLQVLEAYIPTILALNFVEDAKKRGIEIDCEKLEKILRIPVIPINPLTKKGIDKLVDTVLKIKEIPKKTFTIEYDDHIEKAIDKISSQLKETSMPKRFIAIRILEGDRDFYKYLKDERVVEDVKEDLKEYPEVAKDISITRYGTASFIAEKVTQIIPLEKGEIRRERIEEKIDQVLLHKTWGPIITGLFFLAIFGVLLHLGNLIQEVIMSSTESLFSSFGAVEHSIIAMILAQGLAGLVTGVSIALPYVFLFYLLLGLLEDVGLLSRFIVNAERFLRKLGLPGKSFIPLALGFGCTAPAIRATRVLSSKKEQFHTASLFAFIPCSSRIAIIMGIIGFYGGIKLAFSVFATLLVADLIWALGIKKIIHIEREPLLLELPPYRKPLVKNVLAKSWIRMRDFVYIVMPLLVLGGIAYSILKTLGLVNVIIEPLSPIAIWLGLPIITLIPLVFGFLQKDLTGAMLISVLGSKISLILTPIQIYTFGVAGTIGIPCIIALGMLIREFGFKKAVGLTIISIIYGLLFAGLIWRTVLFAENSVKLFFGWTP